MELLIKSNLANFETINMCNLNCPVLSGCPNLTCGCQTFHCECNGTHFVPWVEQVKNS